LTQEDVMAQFRDLSRDLLLSIKHKLQQDLKQQFKHVDDSLFALSLQPKIAEDVTKEIGNVHYNIDKSLESLSKPKFKRDQQYTIAASNKLGDF
jgi:hypothetical protein